MRIGRGGAGAKWPDSTRVSEMVRDRQDRECSKVFWSRSGKNDVAVNGNKARMEFSFGYKFNNCETYSYVRGCLMGFVIHD